VRDDERVRRGVVLEPERRVGGESDGRTSASRSKTTSPTTTNAAATASAAISIACSVFVPPARVLTIAIYLSNH
jgi:hypothetical protein